MFAGQAESNLEVLSELDHQYSSSRGHRARIGFNTVFRVASNLVKDLYRQRSTLRMHNYMSHLLFVSVSIGDSVDFLRIQPLQNFILFRPHLSFLQPLRQSVPES